MCTFVFPPDRLLDRSLSSQLPVGICSSPDLWLALPVAVQMVGVCTGTWEAQTHLESAETSAVESKMFFVKSMS